jgi:GNAT superfamily N-acetyltransferase
MAGTVGEIAQPGPTRARQRRGVIHNRPMTAANTPAIRFAARADLPAVVGLIRELAAYEKLEHLATATPERLEPHLFGERPAAECLVAEHDGRLVAFALFFHNFSTFLCKPGLYLEDLYVQPAARGAGLGRRLLQRLAAIAVERGCGRFEWSVLDWNVDAQAFYARMGATVMPDWRIVRATGDALAAMAASAG